MCQQASLYHYTAGLQTAAAFQQKAVKASTNKARHIAVTELTNWLQQLNLPDKSMQTVTPEDILVFLVQQPICATETNNVLTGKLSDAECAFIQVSVLWQVML